MGAHNIDVHGVFDKNDFNSIYEVLILYNSSPSNLELNEHRFIQELKTTKPLGINSVDPFGIPLLTIVNPLAD